jgi:hypothetical protein
MSKIVRNRNKEIKGNAAQRKKAEQETMALFVVRSKKKDETGNNFSVCPPLK